MFGKTASLCTYAVVRSAPDRSAAPKGNTCLLHYQGLLACPDLSVVINTGSDGVDRTRCRRNRMLP